MQKSQSASSVPVVLQKRFSSLSSWEQSTLQKNYPIFFLENLPFPGTSQKMLFKNIYLNSQNRHKPYVLCENACFGKATIHSTPKCARPASVHFRTLPIYSVHDQPISHQTTSCSSLVSFIARFPQAKRKYKRDQLNRSNQYNNTEVSKVNSKFYKTFFSCTDFHHFSGFSWIHTYTCTCLMGTAMLSASVRLVWVFPPKINCGYAVNFATVLCH